MAKLSDEILSDLAKERGGKGAGKPPPMEPDEEITGDGEESYASDEETAMQDFMEATDAAGKVKALKAFMAICFPQLGQGPGHMDMKSTEE